MRARTRRPRRRATDRARARPRRREPARARRPRLRSRPRSLGETGGHALDLAGPPEVTVGDAALVVRREPDADLAPPDVEVRMVVGFLGQETDPGHEGGGVRER